MTVFADIFDSTGAFLRAKGILPQVSKGTKATPADVEQFRKKTGVALPENFSAFFTDHADGFEFTWEQNEDVCGAFSIPSLKQLVANRQDWKRDVRNSLEDPDPHMDPPLRAQALGIWRRMESWLPFWDEGNGDHFCVELPGGQIVYDQHDWFDGFGTLAKTNGIVAGKSLEDFLRNWSRFCFLRNKSLWWGEFAEFGSIQWDPQYFDTEYCRGD